MNGLIGLPVLIPNEGPLGVVVVKAGAKLLELLLPNTGAGDVVVAVDKAGVKLKLLVPNAGATGAAVVVAVVVESGPKPKLLLPNVGAADAVVLVDGNVKPLGPVKVLAVEDTGNEIVAVVVVGTDTGTGAVDGEPKEIEGVTVLVVAAEVEGVTPNGNKLVELVITVDTMGATGVVVAVVVVPNCPNDIGVDLNDDVGIFDVVVITDGTGEAVTAVVRFVDDAVPN